MANVYFPKPERFDVFALLYVNEQKKRHQGNSYWQTFAQVYENLGGTDCIYGVFSAFNQVSSEAQKRICGFTDVDIDKFLENEDAGKLLAEGMWC